MNMRLLYLVDAGLGLLMFLLAIPMALRRVRPNVWYGFRTRRTLADESVWYAANQYAGRALALAGGVTTAGGLALYWAAGVGAGGALLEESVALALWALLAGLPLAACVIASFAYLGRLTSERPDGRR